MRQIKFRGKRLDNGVWEYGAYCYHIDTTPSPLGMPRPESIHHLILKDGFSDWNMPRSIEAVKVDPETVGQYTGLKDKNSKEIWEGDIFKEDSSGIVRSVFRVPGGLAFEDNPVSFGYDHRAPVYPYSSIAEMQNASWLSQTCEIIGNIHDNPELLKGEDDSSINQPSGGLSNE